MTMVIKMVITTAMTMVLKTNDIGVEFMKKASKVIMIILLLIVSHYTTSHTAYIRGIEYGKKLAEQDNKPKLSERYFEGYDVGFDAGYNVAQREINATSKQSYSNQSNSKDTKTSSSANSYSSSKKIPTDLVNIETVPVQIGSVTVNMPVNLSTPDVHMPPEVPVPEVHMPPKVSVPEVNLPPSNADTAQGAE